MTMLTPPPTIIIRHRLENLKKCSLRGLESRSDFIFVTYPYRTLPDITDYILLTLDAPPLTEEDRHHGLLLVDATWRYANKMVAPLLNHPGLIPRSLPGHFKTAYPRRQTECSDPERGLASIEALYLSFMLTKRPVDGLLDHYHWRNEFLLINHLDNNSDLI